MTGAAMLGRLLPWDPQPAIARLEDAWDTAPRAAAASVISGARAPAGDPGEIAEDQPPS
jgi:hypothetical protein